MSNQKALSSATNKKVNALITSVITLLMLLVSVSLYMFQKRHQRTIVGHQPFAPDTIYNDNNNIDDDIIDPRDDMLNSQSK